MFCETENFIVVSILTTSTRSSINISWSIL